MGHGDLNYGGWYIHSQVYVMNCMDINLLGHGVLIKWKNAKDVIRSLEIALGGYPLLDCDHGDLVRGDGDILSLMMVWV